MEFKSVTGKKIVINPADFEDVWNLKSEIGRVMSGSDFNMNVDGSKEMMDQDFDVAQIAKIALLVDSSRDIRDALFTCLARCTRDGEKITMSTFNDIDAREDYYEIVIACLKENLRPFFKALLSQLSPFMDTLTKATKSVQK
jgi:hypothetical protein